MKWILQAKRLYRLWFLRGVADSDGTVNLRNRAVVISSSPNTQLLYSLLGSLEVKASRWFSHGMGYVGISAINAHALRIFNPEIETYRGITLEKLALARTYPARWPRWLDAKVEQLLKRGDDYTSIRDSLLFKHHTYVKLKTIRKKAVKVLTKPAPRLDRGTPRLRGV